MVLFRRSFLGKLLDGEHYIFGETAERYSDASMLQNRRDGVGMYDVAELKCNQACRGSIFTDAEWVRER
jgi:hypothetical protein